MYDINTLIPFECVIDIDMGLIKLLKYEYRNKEYFFPGILDGPDDCVEYLLITRKNRNPLSIPTNLTKVDNETLDSWYKQFIEKEYNNIIQLSTNTSVADFIKLSSKNTDNIIRTTILCTTEEEAELVKKRSFGQSHVLIADRDGFDLGPYDAVYMKDVYDIECYSNVIGKSLYIANYGFNVLDNDITDDIVLDYTPLIKYLDDNEIRLYTVYNLDPKLYNEIKEVNNGN